MRLLHLFVLTVGMASLTMTIDTRVRAMDSTPTSGPAPMLAPPDAANPVVGKTQVKIGEPKYFGNPPTSASVPIPMELDSSTKGFIDIQLVVTDLRPVLEGNVPAGLTLAAPPQPGKGAVTIQATFPVQKGVEYRIEVTMRYINAMNLPVPDSDSKKIKPSDVKNIP